MGSLLLWLCLIGGRGADAPVREDPSGGTEAAASAPQLAVAPDGTALLAWESRGDRPVVRFSRRESGGWAPPQTLSGDGPAVEPRIAAGPAGRVQAAWLVPDPDGGRGLRVETRASRDGGRNWTAPAHLPGGPASSPTVAVGTRGRTWIAWESPGGSGAHGERDVHLVRSDDGGATWSAPRRVEDDPPGAASSFHPTLVPDGDAVVVAWWDLRNGLDDVFARRLERDPAADGPEIRLDPGPPGAVASHEVSLTRTATGTIRARWREGYGEAPFLARESDDGGRTWGPVTAGAAPAPGIAAPGASAPEPGPAYTEVIAADGSRHRVRVLAVPGPLEYERIP